MEQENVDQLVETMMQAAMGQLHGNESSGQIERLRDDVLGRLAGSGFPEEIVEKLRNRFSAVVGNPVDHEFVVVDLGQNIQVGHAVHIDFSVRLSDSPHVRGAPKVTAFLDSELLDKTGWKNDPKVRREGRGHWSFHQGFALRTRDGSDCPPGRYPITLEFEFNEPVNTELGRFLWTSFKIVVPENTSGVTRELTINADDNSLVNLQITDVQDLGGMHLKATGKGLINVLKVGRSDDDSERHGQESPTNRFAVLLKKNFERANEKPFVSSRWARSSNLTSVAIDFRNGKTSIVYHQEQLSVGRNKSPDNDVTLRWIPQTQESNRLSSDISRRHLIIKLARDGLRVKDLHSTWGTSLNGNEILGNETVSIHPHSHGNIHTISIAKAFDLNLTLLPIVDDAEDFLADPLRDHCGVAASRQPTLWSQARRARLNAVRIERITNLYEENYVLLFREVVLGPAKYERTGIELPVDDGVDEPARLIAMGENIYLERLVPKLEMSIQVDGHELDMRELVPLQVGQQIQIGSSSLEIKEPVQDLSDHRGH